MAIRELTQHQAYPESPFDLFTLKLKGTQTEIGEYLASVARERHSVDLSIEPISSTAFQAKQMLFSRYCPSLVARAAGVSHHFDRDQKSFDPYALSLVQTPSPFACSAAFLGEKNNGLLLRNFDFTLRSLPELLGADAPGLRPMVNPVYLMIIEPDQGFRSIGIVSMDLFTGTFDGINDHGFCVALLALSNASRQMADPRFDAFEEIAIPRILLESCETVEQAISCFTAMPKQTLLIPCHYIVGDRNGNAAVLEWNEASGVGITQRQKSQPLLCTNHYLSSLSQGAPLEGHEAESQQRITTLAAHLPQSINDNGELWAAAEAVRLGVLDEDGTFLGGTLWTALYRTQLPSLTVRLLKHVQGDRAVYSQDYVIQFD